MTLEEFLLYNGSTTTLFKQLPYEYSLKVLLSKEQDGYLTRLVAISLDNEVVLFGVSEAMAAHHFFCNILNSSSQNPIGLKLFAADSLVKRKIMEVTPIDYTNIISPQLINLLTNLGYNLNTIGYKRLSLFSYQDQFMYLTEYVTTSLTKFIQNI